MIKSDLLKIAGVLNETNENQFKKFSQERLKVAEKIASQAKSKGGFSMLTFYHFNAKLNYYEQASKGEFDKEQLIKEYKSILTKLNSPNGLNMKIFQELTGKLEVIGELLIKD